MDSNHVKPGLTPEDFPSTEQLDAVNIEHMKLEELQIDNPQLLEIINKAGNGLCWAYSIATVVGLKELIDNHSDSTKIRQRQVEALKGILEFACYTRESQLRDNMKTFDHEGGIVQDHLFPPIPLIQDYVEENLGFSFYVPDGFDSSKFPFCFIDLEEGVPFIMPIVMAVNDHGKKYLQGHTFAFIKYDGRLLLFETNKVGLMKVRLKEDLKSLVSISIGKNDEYTAEFFYSQDHPIIGIKFND